MSFQTRSHRRCIRQVGNALRFATCEEAETNVQDLIMRWLAVRETRIVVSDDPVNYRHVDGRLERLTSDATMPVQ